MSVNVYSTRTDTEASEANNGFTPQDVDTAAKKVSCPPYLTYATEESQMLESFSSSKSMHKQTPTSVSDHKCQVDEVIDKRIAKMEASLGRFEIILDSVQTDLMRITKGTKGISLELWEKLVVREDSACVMNLGQEQIRISLDQGFRSILEQLSKNAHQDKLQETLSAVLAFPKHMEACLELQKNEIQRSFLTELQALMSKLKASSDHHKLLRAVLESMVNAKSSSEMPLIRSPPVPAVVMPAAPFLPKTETGSQASVKSELTHLLIRNECKKWKRKRASSLQQIFHDLAKRCVNVQDREWRGLVNLDEVPVSDSSCSTVENGTEDRLSDEVKRETERILSEARRRKRKQCNGVIINRSDVLAS